MRKEALLKSESTGLCASLSPSLTPPSPFSTLGCLISLRPIKGSDYFQSDSSSACDPYNDEYFDASECIEHLQVGERSGILTAPVLLDPNHRTYFNMTDSLDTTRYDASH
jgi:hypothetical protein